MVAAGVKAKKSCRMKRAGMASPPLIALRVSDRNVPPVTSGAVANRFPSRPAMPVGCCAAKVVHPIPRGALIGRHDAVDGARQSVANLGG